jgi:hypothetical protein
MTGWWLALLLILVGFPASFVAGAFWAAGILRPRELEETDWS